MSLFPERPSTNLRDGRCNLANFSRLFDGQGNSDGPLVPMVRLVPLENDVIPMVALVNMHLIKGT